MSFVLEDVSENVTFDPKVFVHPLGMYPIRKWKWVINRDREVFLVNLGGGGPWEEGAALRVDAFFLLSWKNEVVRFEVTYDEKNIELGKVGCWIIKEINIPFALKGKREKVLQFIKEAVKVMVTPFFNVPTNLIDIKIAFK